MHSDRLPGYATVFLRLALGIGFLSAVADRLGLWGPPGAGGVAWGNFENFLAYTAVLNPFLPAFAIPIVGVVASVAETVLGVALIVGFQTGKSAFLAGVLLLLFAAGMMVGTGIKSPLDASVLSAAGGALLLALQSDHPLSVDEMLRRRAAPSPPGAARES